MQKGSLFNEATFLNQETLLHKKKLHEGSIMNFNKLNKEKKP